MEREIRDLLRERAEDVRAQTRIPPTVLRRARRRRAVTAVAAAGIAAGVVAAAVVGTRAVLNRAIPDQRRQVPAGTLEHYEGIYPPRATLRAIRKGVVEPEPWSTPERVALQYAENMLGWADGEVLVGHAAQTYPKLTSITNRSLGPRSRISLVLERRGDIYTIASVLGDAIQIGTPALSDVFRPGESVVVAGRAEIPPGASVTASLTAGTAGTGAAAPPGNGEFSLSLEIPPSAESPILVVTVHLRSGATLTQTSFRLAVDPNAPPAEALPSAVESTRAAIIEAARLRDWKALRALIPARFEFSFGLSDDPIRYWKDRQAEGEPVMDILVTLLEGPWAPNEPTNEGKILYVWPGPAVKSADEWTREDIAILRRVASAREIELYRDLGYYIGWRVGIWEDGTWSSFIAGD
jgi:hypothetical protein